MSENESSSTQQEQSDEADQEEPPSEPAREVRSGTSIGTWIAVFGSSTMFHALLLLLLGMIVVSERNQQLDQVTLQVPEDRSEEEKDTIITRKDVEREVKQKAAVDQPQVEETESVNKTKTELAEKTGENIEFTSDTRNDSQIEQSIALSGGTGGGTFGRRGEAGNIQQGGRTGDTQKAVDAALTWLAKHQSDDGRWDTDNYTKQCPEVNRCQKFLENENADVGVTGLAILAFLGAGHTQNSSERLNGIHVGEVVNSGLRWLKGKQKGNGGFHGDMYEHSIATMAFAEAYGMTGAPRLEGIAQKGVDFLQKAQNENESGELTGWRYRPNSGKSDTSVTGWCVMALKSADLAGLETSEEAMQGGLRWVESVTNERGLTGYTEKPSSRRNAYGHRGLTPVGMLTRMFAYDKMTRKRLKVLKQGADFVVDNLPEWNEKFAKWENRKMSFYYWYYGSLTLYMFSGPGTPFEKLGYWQKWNGAMQKAVLSGLQTAEDGHEIGSWDPFSRRSHKGGRIYVTALNTLTLEVYYRYDNALFQ